MQGTAGVSFLVDNSGNNITWASGAIPVAGLDWVSGVMRPLATDQSGQLNVAITVVDSITVTGTQVSGAVIVSGTVSVNSGLIGVLSGSIGAQVSGTVAVSGVVSVSG